MRRNRGAEASYFEAQELRERADSEQAAAEEFRANALKKAYRDVAATAAGKLVLADLINDAVILAPYRKFRGNSEDAYNMGRAAFAAHSKEYLRSILDRETFLEIVEPKKDEENASE